jgi:ACS family glucarate transporter-like MFS transporter
MDKPAITADPRMLQAAYAQPTWVRWRIVALLAALSFVSWFNRVSLPVAYDLRIKGEYGIEPTAMGTVYSALLLIYMLCMTPGGSLTDRFGSRLSLGLMGLGLGVFVALTGVTGYVAVSAGLLFYALLLIRSTMGAFAAPMYPASAHAIACWFPAHSCAWANGFVQAAAPLGIATTYILFSVLIGHFGWPASFLLTGAVTAALGLVWLLYARNRPREHPGVNLAELRLIGGDRESALSDELGLGFSHLDQTAESPDAALQAKEPNRERIEASVGSRSSSEAPHDLISIPSLVLQEGSWLHLLRNRSLVFLTTAYAAVGYFEYLFFFWMHYYFNDVLNVGEKASRFYSAVPVLAMAVGMPVGGWLSDRLVRGFGVRLGRALVPAGGMITGAVLLYLGVHSSGLFWVVTWFSLALAAIGATEAPQWTVAIELGGRRGATAAGIFNTGGNIGGLLAPVITPWISSQFGWQWGITAGSLVCLIGVCLWLWIDPRERVAATV